MAHYTPVPITAAQLQKLQSEFNRLRRENDPRAARGPQGTEFPDDREGRIAWARAHLGAQRINSFTELNMLQAAYLIDCLMVGHTNTKLDLKLRAEWTRLAIHDPAAWFESIQAAEDKPIEGRVAELGGNAFKFRRLELHELNRYQKWKLVEMLSSRAPGAPQRARREFRQPRGGARVSNEQASLWGM